MVTARYVVTAAGSVILITGVTDTIHVDVRLNNKQATGNVVFNIFVTSNIRMNMDKKKIDRKVWAIYSLTPCEDGDYWRYIEHFEVQIDATSVYTALNRVNFLFNCYKVVEVPITCCKNHVLKRGQFPK